jgi:protein SDA1
VLKRIQKTGSNAFKFEYRLLAINFVTRLVGNHELMLLPLYPFLRRYMGGQQRDVTQILSYAVQACHETIPPEEIHGILKTIAHNFITERCSGEQMAVGINACRAICARAPSSLVPEDSNSNTLEDKSLNVSGGSSSVSVDVEAFARDLAGYSKHRDRSVAVAGRAWTNFVREVHPSLLQGKDRGEAGSALHRAGSKPLRFGEQRVASGVAGADLLVEYEAKKIEHLKKGMEAKNDLNESGSDDDDDDEYEMMNDENDDGDDEGWVDVKSGETDEDDTEQKTPTLVPVKIVDGKAIPLEDTNEVSTDKALDLSKMTKEERDKLNAEVSSSRVFTAADFVKMRKLVEREERIKRDPRAAARMKRRKAKGIEFEELSEDDSDYDSEEESRLNIKGVVNATDLMADAKKKRASKIEKLEKVLRGREEFEFKHREGGSTNTEKNRKKSFLMTKFSITNRVKQKSKETARRGTLKKDKKRRQNQHESGKRRRK